MWFGDIGVGEGMREEGIFIHWFSMPRLLEDFRSHVPWCAAGCSQDMKRFFVHYPREAKIRYEEVCIVFWCSEEEVFGFEVSVDNAVIMEVGNCGQGSADEVCRIGFIVASFSTYSVEEFAAEGKVGY